ncbi:hypothetical protein [Pantoea sp. CCBC3-3-1]|uniref:hypothetical protein n=1 Tax=Pantoea sp. CCBC3-3-1 TaxID=2490851 RepID=UPI0011BDCDA8|nr:hypothetical protein [Pantoea sp. CCBC3-3-1]
MSELKAGGLALVTGAFTIAGSINIGKVVTVEFLLSDGEKYVAPNGKAYHCISTGIAAVITGGRVYNVVTKKNGWAQVSCKHLHPIDRPDGDKIIELHRELMHG